jgi:hypothetical protein
MPQCELLADEARARTGRALRGRHALTMAALTRAGATAALATAGRGSRLGSGILCVGGLMVVAGEESHVDDDGQCLLCGTSEDLTVEHIVPRTLWRRFDIDPDRDDLAVFRTNLCDRHNQATSALHRRPEMMDFIDCGEPVTRRTLLQLGEWSVWVTLLLGLARGSSVLGSEVSRATLLNRFDGGGGGVPAGVRVYAARVSEHIAPTEPPITPYMLALVGDRSVLLDASGRPCGMTFGSGPISASESIRIGRIALLVVGRSHSSGPAHERRLDEVVQEILGLERIHPLPARLPELTPTRVSMRDVSRLFTLIPLPADPLLLPPQIRSAWQAREGY